MENRHRTYQRQSMGLVFFLFVLVLLTLLGRLFYLMIGKADYYGVQAKELHERERKIKAERGEIKDCHGNVLATKNARFPCEKTGAPRTAIIMLNYMER